jgi:hypothetical protein
VDALNEEFFAGIFRNVLREEFKDRDQELKKHLDSNFTTLHYQLQELASSTPESERATFPSFSSKETQTEQPPLPPQTAI